MPVTVANVNTANKKAKPLNFFNPKDLANNS